MRFPWTSSVPYSVWEFTILVPFSYIPYNFWSSETTVNKGRQTHTIYISYNEHLNVLSCINNDENLEEITEVLFRNK
jgi:hypothetical protein